MQKVNNIRLISKKELQEVNPQLLATFGNLNRIASGSVVEYENGKKNYHIQLVGQNPYKPIPMLEKIGKKLKRVWGADEIFCYGIKIA